MDKKILVIGRRDAGEKNDAMQLAKAIGRHSAMEVVGAYYEQIVVSIDNDAVSATLVVDDGVRDITEFDTTILVNWSHHRLYADLAHAIALILRRAHKRVWNEELIDARSSSKLSQLVELSDTQVAIPRTLFSLTPGLVRSYIDEIGVPFVAKDPLASRGRSNFLCEDWNTFTGHQEDGRTYLFQEYIPNDQSDMRMFVLAMEPKLAILRQGSGESHLNNISAGAHADLVALESLPAKLLEDTELVARRFRRNLCGVDFMRNTITSEYIFLEINTTPQIVNGAFVEEKIDAFVDALNNEETY